ncbi:MAG: guanylate kinase [Bacteriovoracaceae bacterium]|nr:guanylate kinase [Bacteriovoracaceae bacterium]
MAEFMQAPGSNNHKINHKTNKVFLLVAPTACGKTTLLDFVAAQHPEFKRSISHTTRPRRPQDVDGRDYFFVTPEQFKQMIEQQAFLEWAVHLGNYYGTSKAFIEEQLALGHSILGDVDLAGADAFKRILGDKVTVIFIAPPSFAEIEKRLRGRQSESEEVIQQRLALAKEELAHQNDYDYLLVNDDLAKAQAELQDIIAQELSGKR